MINQDMINGTWTEFQGKVREEWGQLTENDVAECQGNVEQLIGLIQRKTGEARDNIEQTLQRLSEDGASFAAQAKSAVHQAAEQANARLHEGMDHAAESLRNGYRDAEKAVQDRPLESVAVAFGSGLIAGVIVGLIVRK